MTKDDREHDRGLAWGLNLDVPEVTTQAEIDEFRRISGVTMGTQQDGLDYWLDLKPEVLKRYRLWADTIRVIDVDDAPNKWNASGAMIEYVYAMTGFDDGLAYNLIFMNRKMTKEQLLEQLALVFRYAGPRGMATIAKVASAHEWVEPVNPSVWPAGWGPDPDVFKCGVDYSSRAASDEDMRKICDWYERWIGEVPGHVRAMARLRPDLLKAYRARYENTLHVLPKQTEPWVLLQISLLRGSQGGIREALLLGKAFGITRNQIVEAISWGTFYGGNELFELVDRVGGDILDSWR